jgi:hypothetical protein
MYDVHGLLNRFYDEEVRLGNDRRRKLAELRDTNLDRLAAGLEQLGPMRGAETAAFESFYDQGSYAMHTLNQHPDNEYDIDTAVIFAEESLPADPLGARKRIAEALNLSGAVFSREPEARTNAVTIWYAAGNHVDLAVYREMVDGSQKWLEHAGANWTRRDPQEVTNWFLGQVKQRSPADIVGGARKNQLRRVVRLIKKFARSRTSWSLPCGFILTVLAVEQYRADAKRDDVALYNTLVAIQQRVRASTDVRNPVNNVPLTSKDEHHAQVRRLGARLDELLPKMSPLFMPGCTEKEACRAWNLIFRHDFWSVEATRVDEAVGLSGAFGSAASAAVGPLPLRVEVSDREGGRVRVPYYEGQRLPKDAWLRFYVENVPLRPGQELWWIVENDGDEARAANDMGHTHHGTDRSTWRHTAYHGAHRMICELRSGSSVLARGVCSVKVAA